MEINASVSDDCNQYNSGSCDSQAILGHFNNTLDKVDVAVLLLCRRDQYGPVIVSVVDGNEDNPQSVCSETLRIMRQLIAAGGDVELAPGARFVIPRLLDSHVLVALPPEIVDLEGQQRSFQQIMCAIEVKNSTTTVEEVLAVLGNDFHHPSCQSVTKLYGYDLRRLDNNPDAFCPGSVLIGIMQAEETSIPSQMETCLNQFNIPLSEPNSRLTQHFDLHSNVLPPSYSLGEASRSLGRNVVMASTSRPTTVEQLHPFKHGSSRPDDGHDDDEQPSSPPNISLVPVGSTAPHLLEEDGDSTNNTHVSSKCCSGSSDDNVEHEQPSNPSSVLPSSPEKEKGVHPAPLPLQEDGGSSLKLGDGKIVQLKVPVSVAQPVCPDSAADDCNVHVPVFGLDCNIVSHGTDKERVVVNMPPVVSAGKTDCLVLPHDPTTQGSSLEKILDMRGKGVETFVGQETHDDNLDTKDIVVCALEHACNSYCSLCRLQNPDECRIVCEQSSIVEKQRSLVSSIRKISSAEEEQVKGTIRRHCQWCRDIHCKVPHIYAGCPSPGMQSLSRSLSFSPPITAEGTQSKEVCVPPPRNLPTSMPDAHCRIANGVMFLNRPEDQRHLQSRRQIEFPNNIVGKDHGDVVYIRQDMPLLDGCFKHLPPLSDIRKQDILGKGGNGIVFRYPFNRVPYAFKLTTYRKVELQIWSMLQSENVTSLLAVLVYNPPSSTSPPRCLQVMDLLSGTLHSNLELIGGSLAEALNREPDLWRIFNNTWNILRQVLSGLNYLAENKVYYCDLKTSNVLVQKRCKCDCIFHCVHYNDWSLHPCMKLGDFDSARTVKTANTEAYTNYRNYPVVMKSPEKCAKELGTVGNRAPEQFVCLAPVVDPVSARNLNCGLVGHSSDMWCFGTLVLRTFLGRTPIAIKKEAWFLLMQPYRSNVDKSFPQHEIMSTLLMLNTLCIHDDQDFRKAGRLAKKCLKGDYRERPSAYKLLEEFQPY